MSCVKQLRRRRIARLSILWIAFVLGYYIFGVLLSTDWQMTETGKEVTSYKMFAPFRPNETKSVVLLTYQRGGSTLFGNMFNSNPNIFYLFEPLDALYTDIFGTSRGWNVPSEITNYWNGSQRNLPVFEISEVYFFLRQIFQCDVDQLPISFLVHPYYFLYRKEYQLLDKYITCIDNIDKLLDLCVDIKPEIENFCGTRFGEKPDERSLQCYEMLQNYNYDVKDAPGRVRQAVFNYKQCIRRLRKQIDEACTPLIRDVCADRPVRAVKCVRATMDSMEPLLENLPNFRVIHLMRDPRGVVLSRIKFHDSTRNRYSDSGNDTMVREAELYCRTVMRDIEKSHELQKKYPGKILPLVYDDFVTDIGAHTRKIYQFLELEMPNSTAEWIKEASKGVHGRDAVTIANAWQQTLTYRDSKSIVERCTKYFELTKKIRTL